MNLQLTQNEVKMTSRELATLTEKQHKNILRDIRLETDVLGIKIAETIFELGEYRDENNQLRVQYVLTEDGIMQLALKYNAKMRYTIIQQVKKLKQALQMQLPQSRLEWIRFALKQEEEIQMKNQMLLEYEPKVKYYNEILNSDGLITITQIAKDYGLSGVKLNKILHEKGVQYKQSKQWLLYRTYQDKGFTKSVTVKYKHTDGKKDIALNTKWTQKGRLFIHSLMEQLEIVALMDR